VTGNKTIETQSWESATSSLVQVLIQAHVSDSKIITAVSNQVFRTSSFLQVVLESLGGTINYCLQNIRIQVRSKFVSLYHKVGDYIADFQSLLQLNITIKQSGGMQSGDLFSQDEIAQLQAIDALPDADDDDDRVRHFMHDFPDEREVKDMLGILPQVPKDDQRNEPGGREGEQTQKKKRLTIEEPRWNSDLIFKEEINVLSEGFNILE